MLPHHGGTKRPAPQDQQSANSNNQNNKRVALSENSSAAATPSPSSSRPARSPATSTTGAAAPSTLVQPKPKAGGGLLDSIRAGKFIRTSNGASSAAESGDSALASPSAAMARASAMTPSSSAATLAAAAKARTEYQVVFPSMGSIVPPSNRHTVLNRFIVELQRIYPNDKDAGYKEALALEQKVYSAANSKMGYTNGAAHALGSLKERRQGQAPIVHADKYAMEQNIEKYLLTREQLLENGFLLSSADHVQSETTAAAPRVCERCDTLLDMDDVHTSGVEPDPSSSGKVPLLSTCQHHPGRVWQRRRGNAAALLVLLHNWWFVTLFWCDIWFIAGCLADRNRQMGLRRNGLLLLLRGRSLRSGLQNRSVSCATRTRTDSSGLYGYGKGFDVHAFQCHSMLWRGL
ncbi:exonuclease GOR, variant 1 [Capsaspora owczarzaki ATCC 30864]|uniref:Exonuclease GOR, variant 1 n=1 Tax=Capsaspora owczarzaki (strain ATCC 30864) TaxID=595528 RepID=A0A0D2U692_CAPO3|nr:exonuclease GOR, variant 1 [Capsaspora owczarzaki ATCC 30864]